MHLYYRITRIINIPVPTFCLSYYFWDTTSSLGMHPLLCLNIIFSAYFIQLRVCNFIKQLVTTSRCVNKSMNSSHTTECHSILVVLTCASSNDPSASSSHVHLLMHNHTSLTSYFLIYHGVFCRKYLYLLIICHLLP